MPPNARQADSIDVDIVDIDIIDRHARAVMSEDDLVELPRHCCETRASNMFPVRP